MLVGRVAKEIEPVSNQPVVVRPSNNRIIINRAAGPSAIPLVTGARPRELFPLGCAASIHALERASC
ncbi:MAG: hypothetical protein MK312_12110, partial [Roseibacillus sp.]|nr:hypothetical protein [Roseibacillus sp.]